MAHGGGGTAKAHQGVARGLQVHQKGVGLICVAPGGFSQGEYLGDYLGEVFPPWRWCEREDAGVSVKKVRVRIRIHSTRFPLPTR